MWRASWPEAGALRLGQFLWDNFYGKLNKEKGRTVIALLVLSLDLIKWIIDDNRKHIIYKLVGGLEHFLFSISYMG